MDLFAVSSCVIQLSPCCLSSNTAVFPGITWSSHKRGVIVGRCTARCFWVSHVKSGWRFGSACSNEGSVPEQHPPTDVTQPQTSKAHCSIQCVEWSYRYTVACLRLTTSRQFSQQSETTLFKFIAYIIIHFIGSLTSDHYFPSVCLFVCLFVCAEFFSAIFDPISIKLGHMLYVWV